MKVLLRPKKGLWQAILCGIFLSILAASTVNGNAQTAPTNIQINGAIQQTSVTRLGVNLSDQVYWDSGQMTKNLIFINPGFEGMAYRSILHCATVLASSCTDDNEYSPMPTGFWKGGTYQFISGLSNGKTGTIVNSLKNPATCSGCGQILTLDSSLNIGVGDYLIARNTMPGNAQAGWWTDTSGGGTLATEFSDLSPETPGKQALRMTATGSGTSVSISSAFDSTTGLSFIQLNGHYQLSFRAKGVGGSNHLQVLVQRLTAGRITYVNQTIPLAPSWNDYNINFAATEDGSAVGTVQVIFTVSGSAALLDDASLVQTDSDPTNTTIFRDEVVNTLQALKPGVIRMMAAGAALGAEISDQLAVPFARVREGFSTGSAQEDAIPYGIHEFLQLCAKVGADPWLTIPTATSPQEAANLADYLGGDGSTPYSAIRVARGQAAPWTSVFKTIHIELGNETWNGSFRGEYVGLPTYPIWANGVFGAMRKAQGFNASKFDLVLSGLAASPGYNQSMLQTSTQHDSVDIAPYLLFSLNDTSLNSMFQGLFAEAEMFDSPSGEVGKNVSFAQTSARPAKVSVYETNLSPIIGTATKTELDQLTPSVGAGIGSVEHMLQMMRAGVNVQSAFALPQFNFRRGDGTMVKLWGIVLDMGTTNRRRPQFIAEALANSVIAGNMLQTQQTGTNPTFNQPLNVNVDSVQINGAHYLQSFAFQNGSSVSTILFNLSQTSSLPVTFSGSLTPAGTVQICQLTSADITDNNETSDTVQTTNSSSSNFNAATPLSLPPFSMTVLTWNATVAATPTFSLPAGTYAGAQTVALADSTPGSTIYYTTNGSAPSTASTKYSGPITVSQTETIQAIALATGCTNSSVASATYTINNIVNTPPPPPPTPTASNPAISLAAGTYTGVQTVILTDSTPGAVIYYTTNGATPTTASTRYTGPISVSSTETVKAIAVAPGYLNSGVVSAAYTIDVSTTTIIGFNAQQLALNSSAKVVQNTLQLTSGSASQQGSVWYNKLVAVNSFTTDFNFQIPSAAGDGFTFTIHNDPKGVWALGANASGLGYQFIAKSVAVKFDLHQVGANTAGSTGQFANGVSPAASIYLTGSGLNLHSGNIFHAHLAYDGKNLTLTLTDTKTAKVFTQAFAVNIPAIVGSNTALIGFTGSTGGLTAVQNVLSWTYGD